MRTRMLASGMVARIILFLISSTVLLECQAIPYDVSPEQEEIALNQSTFFRLNSNESELSEESRSLMTGMDEYVPGIDPQRYIVLSDTKPFPDEKDCGTGQDPLNTTEAKILRKHYADLFEELKPRKERKSMYYTIVPDDKIIERGGENCQSGKCSLNVAAMSYVCGNGTRLNFISGSSCIDGSEPEISKDVLEERKTQRITKETEEEINRDVTKVYGMNCKTGKCLYDFKTDDFICSATVIEPITIFALSLVVLLLEASR